MFQTLLNVFRVPEVRNKVLFTLLMLLIYRIGFHIPIPGVDQAEFASNVAGDDNSAAGRLASYAAIFSGGSLSNAMIFGLGIMPFISAAIIFQLLSTVVPSLEALKKEGEIGQRKIQEWTRYATVPLAAVQAVFWLRSMPVQSYWQGNATTWWVVGMFCLVGGCVFLMWLGEQIDEYGIGNGISLLIMANILAQVPGAIGIVVRDFDASAGAAPGKMGTGSVLFLIVSFVCVTALAILVTQAQRRIPIQQAKHTRGRRVYGGQKQFLPLRVNHGGVMPIIFAQSLILIPGVLLAYLASRLANSPGFQGGWVDRTVGFFNRNFEAGQFFYVMTEIALIFFFSFFWNTVQFQPKEIAKQLKDYGSFIPGIRPGPRTADYLERVMTRVTFVGAAFLCFIAVVPTVVSVKMGINPLVASFLGGTGLLIVISVALDMVQRIEANLMMRRYGGFLGGGGGKGGDDSGRRVRGGRNY